MAETRTVHDPFLGVDAQISDRLTDRLRGRYACGPTLPSGEPEFGWREHQAPPIQHEAAARIDALAAEIERLRAQGGVPEGWQLVPKEPTREHYSRYDGRFCTFETWSDEYRSMLSAAPTPPLSAGEADERETALVRLVHQSGGISTDDPEVEKYCDDRGSHDDTVNRCCKRGDIKQIGDHDTDNFSLVPWWWPYANAEQARRARKPASPLPNVDGLREALRGAIANLEHVSVYDEADPDDAEAVEARVAWQRDLERFRAALASTPAPPVETSDAFERGRAEGKREAYAELHAFEAGMAANRAIKNTEAD